MTRTEIADLFPNGLHDAEVESLHIDEVRRTVTMTVDVWVGSLEEPGDADDSYRRGILELRGLQYCSTEAPAESGPAPFTCRIWVNDRNGFVYLAAQEARFTWTAEAVNRGRAGP